MPPEKPMIDCGFHGTTEWEEDFECDNCGKAYLHDDPDKDHFPDVCSCGVRLRPHDHKAMKFSATPICASCASKIRELRNPLPAKNQKPS